MACQSMTWVFIIRAPKAAFWGDGDIPKGVLARRG